MPVLKVNQHPPFSFTVQPGPCGSGCFLMGICKLFVNLKLFAKNIANYFGSL